jgi:hypothetical protein
MPRAIHLGLRRPGMRGGSGVDELDPLVGLDLPLPGAGAGVAALAFTSMLMVPSYCDGRGYRLCPVGTRLASA